MSSFIDPVMEVLSIQITLGSFTTSLGSLLFFLIILRIAYNRFLSAFIFHQAMERRAGQEGFTSYAERESYETYMAGGDRHKDGTYY